jgi:hypothetical protein
MWFRNGAILYAMDDEEHEKWHNREIMASRRKSSVIDLSGRVGTFNNRFSFSASSRRKSSGFIKKDVTVHVESLELS